MKSFPGLLLVFLFVILLFIVKKVYKKANRFLIGKKLIKKEYDQKDFTYVMWSDAIPDWWNEKLASKPSWFDYLITVLLLILPIWLMIILTKILRIS